MNYIPQAENCMKKGGRIETIDIAKGLGILFVVWSHAKGPFTPYMYQFHMPLFFDFRFPFLTAEILRLSFLAKGQIFIYSFCILESLLSSDYNSSSYTGVSDIHLVKKYLKLFLH